MILVYGISMEKDTTALVDPILMAECDSCPNGQSYEIKEDCGNNFIIF